MVLLDGRSFQLHGGRSMTGLFFRYLASVVALALVILIRWLLDPVLESSVVLLCVPAAVAFAAWFGGFGPAVVVTVGGWLASAWLFMEPRGGLTVDEPARLVSLVLYLATCGVIVAAAVVVRSVARRQSETLRITLSSIGDAVITTDAQARVIFLNPVAEELTGWKTVEASGRAVDTVFRIVDEDTRRQPESPVARVLRLGHVTGLANHTLLIARDGTERPIDDSAAPVRDADGRLTGVVLVFRDVTKRRQAERILRRSEWELTDFFENAPIAVRWVGADGTIIRANQAELKLLGYAREEYVGRHFGDFAADGEDAREVLRRLNRGEKLRDHPIRMRRKDGAVRDVVIDSATFVEDEKVSHTCFFSRDVTDRRRVQREQAMLANIVETSEDAIVSKNLDGIIQSWNAAAERVFGYTAEEAIGRHIALIIPPERREEETGIMTRLRAGERVEHYESVRQRKDGVRIDVSLTISPLRNEVGVVEGASKIARDVTGRKQTEQRLMEADRRKDEFLATLAHELRNPLAPIRNALEIMKRSESEVELSLAARGMLERQLGHLVRLVDDLLDVSRITRDRLELRLGRVELASIVRQAVEAGEPLMDERRQKLQVDLPSEPIYLLADPVRLAQVFGNLLSNASKYTEPGGDIRVGASRQDGQVTVTVTDTGIGIGPDSLERVFEMFAQVHDSIERAQGGLGIGLTLVRRLVEMHGGTIRAWSAGPGKGSEFTVVLPELVDKEASLGEPGRIPDEAPTGSFHDAEAVTPRRVLVVDDNLDSAGSLATLLRLSGHETHAAHDGLQAVEAARELRPDVILLDIGLPGLNGYEVCRAIRGQAWGRDIRIVALTGWGQQQDRRRSEEAGFNTHLVKPVDPILLASVLAGDPRSDHPPGGTGAPARPDSAGVAEVAESPSGTHAHPGPGPDPSIVSGFLLRESDNPLPSS